MNLPLAELTEAQWSGQIRELATLLDYWGYHTLRSKGSAAGWPDWAFVRERIVYLELKSEKGKLTPHQRDVIGRLLAAGAEVYVGRPSDWDDLAAVLRSRGRVFDGPAWDAHERLVERTRAEVDA